MANDTRFHSRGDAISKVNDLDAAQRQALIDIDELDGLFDDETEVDLAALKAAGLTTIHGRHPEGGILYHLTALGATCVAVINS